VCNQAMAVAVAVVAIYGTKKMKGGKVVSINISY
jgi:hypothetical protein